MNKCTNPWRPYIEVGTIYEINYKIYSTWYVVRQMLRRKQKVWKVTDIELER